jgi:hypothetical protein
VTAALTAGQFTATCPTHELQTDNRAAWLAHLQDEHGTACKGVKADATPKRRTARRIPAQRKAPTVKAWDPRALDAGAWVTFRNGKGWHVGDQESGGIGRTGQVWSAGPNLRTVWVVAADRAEGEPSAWLVNEADATPLGTTVPAGLFDEDDAPEVDAAPVRVEPSADRTFPDVAAVRAHWVAGGDEDSAERVSALRLTALSDLVMLPDSGLIAARSKSGWQVLHAGSGKSIGDHVILTKRDTLDALRMIARLSIAWGASSDAVLAELHAGSFRGSGGIPVYPVIELVRGVISGQRQTAEVAPVESVPVEHTDACVPGVTSRGCKGECVRLERERVERAADLQERYRDAYLWARDAHPDVNGAEVSHWASQHANGYLPGDTYAETWEAWTHRDDPERACVPAPDSAPVEMASVPLPAGTGGDCLPTCSPVPSLCRPIVRTGDPSSCRAPRGSVAASVRHSGRRRAQVSARAATVRPYGRAGPARSHARDGTRSGARRH